MTSELQSRRAHTALRKPIALKKTGRLTGVSHSILPPSPLHMAVTLLLWRVQWYEQICCACPLSLSPIYIVESYSFLLYPILPSSVLSYPVLFCSNWYNPILAFYHPVKKIQPQLNRRLYTLTFPVISCFLSIYSLVLDLLI